MNKYEEALKVLKELVDAQNNDKGISPQKIPGEYHALCGKCGSTVIPSEENYCWDCGTKIKKERKL